MSATISVKYLYTQCNNCGISLKCSEDKLGEREVFESYKRSNKTLRYKLSNFWICKISEPKGFVLKTIDKAYRKAYNKVGEVIIEFKENKNTPSIKTQKHICPYVFSKVTSVANKTLKKEYYEQLK